MIELAVMLGMFMFDNNEALESRLNRNKMKAVHGNMLLQRNQMCLLFHYKGRHR